MIINQYIQVRPKYRDDDEPIFVFRDASPVKPNNLRVVLRKALTAIELE